MPNDSTMNFRADISQLKAAMQEAGRAIRLANSEFKAATAGMQDWGNSADGLQAKLKQLGSVLGSQKSQLALMEQELEKTAKVYGENSAEADRVRIKINNQKAAVANTEKQIESYTQKLEGVKQASEQVGELSKLDQQKQRIKELETELNGLKSEYTSLQLEERDTTEESERLAREISQLSGELKDAKADLSNAEKAADELDQSLEEVEDSADKAGSGFTVLKGALADLLADGIRMAVDGFKDLAKETFEAGANFESAMSQVEAVSGASTEQLAQLTEKAKEMGETTKFSATESAEAFNYMAMAGWSTEDMISGIAGVMNLAAASGADLATTSDIVTDALTAMGYSAGESGRLADVMAAASSNANTNVELMGQTFQYAAPIVGALGYNMEDTAVAIGMMANAGIKGDKAGTALRSILTRLSTDAGASSKKLGALGTLTEKLGVEFYNADGTCRDLNDVIVDARKAWKGLSEEEQTSYAKTIAGQNAMGGWLALMNGAETDFNKLTNAVRNSTGAAQEMADTMNDNVSGQITLLKSKIEGIMIKVFEKASDRIRQAISAISRALDGVNWDAVADRAGKALQSLVNVFIWILNNGRAVGAILTIIGTTIATASFGSKIVSITKNVNDLSTALTALSKTSTLAGVASKALGGAMAAVPYVAVAAGIAALCAALINYSDKQEAAIGKEYELTEEQQRHIDAVEQERQSIEEANKARTEAIGKANSEANYLSSLKNEYNSLIDSNGKVKKGYKDRADFIITTLADALGVERSEIEKTIKKNGELGKSIDEIIQKKKAEAVLSAMEGEYTTAIQNRDSAIQEYASNLKTLDEKEAAYAETKKKVAEAQKRYDEAVQLYGEEAAQGAAGHLKEVSIENRKAKEAYETTKKAVDDAKKNYVDYNTTIKNYEGLSSAVMEGDSKKIEKALQKEQNAFITSKEGTREILQQQVKDYEDKYYNLKAALDNGLPGVTKAEVAGAKKMVDAAKKELEKLEPAAKSSHKKAAKGAQAGLKSGQKGIANTAKQIVNATVKEANKGAKKHNTAGKKSGKAQATGIKSTQKENVNAARTVTDAAQKKASQEAKKFRKSGSEGGRQHASGYSSTKKASVNAAKSVSDSAQRAASGEAKNFRKPGSAGGGQYAKGIGSKSGAAGTAAAELASSALKKLKGDSYSKGVDFGQGFAKGISSKVSTAASAAASIAQAGIDAIKKIQQSQSPSKVTYRQGTYFTQGYINGIASLQKSLQSTVSGLVAGVIKNLNKLSQFEFAAAGQTASTAFAEAFSARSTYLMNRVTYQNEENLKVFDKEIAKLQATQANKAAAIQKVSDSRVKAMEAKRNKEKAAFEKSRDRNVDNIEKARDKRVAALEQSRDKKVAALEKARDKKVAQLEKKRAGLKKASDKAKVTQVIKQTKQYYNQQIKATKTNAAKEIKEEKAIAAKKIKAEKAIAAQNIKTSNARSKKQIASEKAAAKKSIAASNAIYNKQIAAQNRQKEAYQTASSEMLSELQNALSEYQSKAQQLIDDTINGISDKYTELYNDVLSKQTSLVEKLQSAGDLFEVSGAGVMTVNDLKAQTKAINDYAAKLEKIRGKVSEELFDQISSYDMTEGSAFMDRLLSMSTKDLEAYNKAYTEKLKAAQAAGDKIYKADFDKIAMDYKADIDKAFKSIPEKLQDLGIQAMKGFTSGLTKNTDYMSKAIKGFVNQMVAEFKKQLKIKSPSRVTASIGVFAGEGVADGLMDTIKTVQSAARRVAGAVSSPLDDISGSIGGIRAAVRPSGGSVYNSQVVNNYNLVQNNTSPRSLSALETYQARRRQIAMLKAATRH